MPKHAAPPPPRRLPDLGMAIGVVLVLAVAAVAYVLVRDDGDGGPTTAAAAGAVDTPTSASPATTATTAPSTTTTTRDPVLGSGESVTLAFAGDTYFEGAVAARLDADPASVLGPFAGVLSAADVAVVNMETALGFGGSPEDKEFTFQAPPAALEAFRAAGVDVVSAANNHGMDFGVGSLHETLAAERDLGFPIIGIGLDEAEAYAPFLVEVRGQRIAVLAATQVLDGHLIDDWTATPEQPGLASAKRADRLVQAVVEARAVADTVVVYLHWGIETETCPAPRQQELAQQLADAGADVIVGGHAHRLQGGGRLGDAVVHYGLGNFGFGARSDEAARTGVFVVTVTGRRVDAYEWVPGRVVDAQPRPLEGDEAAEAVAHWDSLRDCTGLTP